MRRCLRSPPPANLGKGLVLQGFLDFDFWGQGGRSPIGRIRGTLRGALLNPLLALLNKDLIVRVYIPKGLSYLVRLELTPKASCSLRDRTCLGIPIAGHPKSKP